MSHLKKVIAKIIPTKILENQGFKILLKRWDIQNLMMMLASLIILMKLNKYLQITKRNQMKNNRKAFWKINFQLENLIPWIIQCKLRINKWIFMILMKINTHIYRKKELQHKLRNRLQVSLKIRILTYKSLIKTIKI